MEYIYAALLLHKLGKSIDETNLSKVIQASGAEVDASKVKSLVVNLKGLDIDSEIANAVAVSASASPSQSGGEAKPKEEKKEEKKEAAAEGLASLFG
jgi:large subunit ribosomal protein L12